MAKNGFKILDSDMHIMEPPDLWERYIDQKFKARAPRGVTSGNVRDLRMVYPDGRDWARTTTRQNDSARGHNFERNQNVYRADAARGWTPEVQLDAMDIEGIDVAVLYPTRGLRALVVPDMDADFAAAIARAYNDWLYDFCKRQPQRLIGAGMISPYDMNDAVAEARRCAESMRSRWSRCWRSAAFAPAACWRAIRGCASRFWKRTAAGYPGYCGGWTKAGNAKVISGRRT